MVRLVLWLFVRVTVLAVLVVPTGRSPKFRLGGEKTTGAIPVAERLTTLPPWAPVATVIAPLIVPKALGAKVTSMAQLAPGESEEGQLLVWE